MQSLKDEVPALRDRHLRVVDLFRSRDIESLDDVETCVEVLADERLRAEFTVKLKQFLGSLDMVLPRPEGLPSPRTPRLSRTSTRGPAIAIRTRRFSVRMSAPRSAS